MGNKKFIFGEDHLVEILRLKHQEGLSNRSIAKIFNCGKSTIGDFLTGKTYSDFWKQYHKKPLATGSVENKLEERKVLKGKRFVFTSAQNNTFVHEKFLKSLETYCEVMDASLIVSTFHYNKSGYQLNKTKDLWYDPKIRGYIVDEPCQVAEGLVFGGEINILPTAVNPLSGFHNYFSHESGVIPHVKIQMESLPSPKNESARFLYTTGAVTQRNYIQMKAGNKASFHHCFGALVVEVDEEGDWFARQIHAEQKTGCFYDLDKYFTPEGFTFGNNIEAINYGDVHAAKLDDVVAKTSWGKSVGHSSILDTLKPSYQLVHDAMDQQARNHHNIKDPHFLFEMFTNKTESLKDEIIKTANVLREMERDFSEVVVVESNHDTALEKYLKEQDYRKDPINAVFFLELQLDKYYAMERGNKDFQTFENAIIRVAPDLYKVRFLKTDETFRVKDIECGQHGSYGVNGSRGSISAFQKQGIKFNVGHSHSAAIKDGVYYAGVSGKLDMGYNKGGSSWSQSHILTYKNGKRAIVTLKNGKWRS